MELEEVEEERRQRWRRKETPTTTLKARWQSPGMGVFWAAGGQTRKTPTAGCPQVKRLMEIILQVGK